MAERGLKLSVVICTYNRAELLKGALETLNDQYLPRSEYQIIVVDDGSTDDTEKVMRQATRGMYERLEYYKIDHAGRAAARNKGISEAKGDYILFVDDDILAPPELLQEHHEYHKRNPHIVVRGPIINIQDYKIPTGHSASWRDYSSAFFCTCNASVSKYALLQVGGFDQSFVAYGFEDNELGWRLREKGWKAVFNMKAIVYHYKPIKPKEHLSGMIRQAQEQGRSAVAYYQKHPHWKVALATGLHPALRPWNCLLMNGWFHRMCMRQWERRVDDMSSGLRSFLESRIFQYHYLRTLERVTRGLPDELDGWEDDVTQPHHDGGLRPPDQTEGPRGRQDVAPEGITPSNQEPARLADQNIRADVHLQSEKPPWESA